MTLEILAPLEGANYNINLYCADLTFEDKSFITGTGVDESEAFQDLMEVLSVKILKDNGYAIEDIKKILNIH